MNVSDLIKRVVAGEQPKIVVEAMSDREKKIKKQQMVVKKAATKARQAITAALKDSRKFNQSIEGLYNLDRSRALVDLAIQGHSSGLGIFPDPKTAISLEQGFVADAFKDRATARLDMAPAIQKIKDALDDIEQAFVGLEKIRNED